MGTPVTAKPRNGADLFLLVGVQLHDYPCLWLKSEKKGLEKGEGMRSFG